MTFSPPRPTAGQAVEVSVTSARSLPNVSLSGTFAPVPSAVELGGVGDVWTWSVRVDGPGQYTYDFNADGEVCISRVLDLLAADGFDVGVVQNPTVSLEGDLAATRRVS